MDYQERKKERERVVLRLRSCAQYNYEAQTLLGRLELEVPLVLRDPGNAPKCLVNSYNKLVRASSIREPQKKDFLMIE